MLYYIVNIYVLIYADIGCCAERENEAPKKITRPLAFHAPAYYFIILYLTGEPYEQTGF